MEASNKALTEKLAIIALVYLFFGKPLLNKISEIFGFSSEGKKKVEAEALNQAGAFNPAFWHNYFYAGSAKPNGRKPITSAIRDRITAAAKRLHKCFGILEDDEEGVVSVFAGLKNQSEVSMMAERFQAEYSKNMYEYLQTGVNVQPSNGLSTNDLNKLITFVYTLPLN